MGFLMGAYGKLMTGKLVRDIQFQMIGIQSRLRRVTREIQDKTKLYESQERNMSNMIQMQMQGALSAAQYQAFGVGYDPTSGLYGAQKSGWQFAAMANSGAFDQKQAIAYSAVAQEIQMNFALAQNLWKDSFEMQKQADLQALKDLEDSLQLEKDNLESQLQIAKQEYDAYKQEEKADAKNLVPEYTPQG